jgi:hypothetical protein
MYNEMSARRVPPVPAPTAVNQIDRGVRDDGEFGFDGEIAHVHLRRLVGIGLQTALVPCIAVLDTALNCATSSADVLVGRKPAVGEAGPSNSKGRT